MSRLLTLDQSSQTSGWAYFEDNKLVKYGKFTFDYPDIGVRLTQIRKKVKELIETYLPDEVVFEDIQLQENTKTFKILAEVYGVIYELVSELGIKNDAVLASSWKSTLGIKGRARAEQKRNAQQYIINNYGIKPTQDECDAICIGLHHILSANPNDWSK